MVAYSFRLEEEEDVKLLRDTLPHGMQKQLMRKFVLLVSSWIRKNGLTNCYKFLNGEYEIIVHEKR